MNLFNTRSAKPSPAPLSAELEARLRLGQYRLVSRSMRPSVVAMPAFCFILCFIFSQWITLPWLIAWWVAVTAGALCNALPYFLERRAAVQTDNVGRWVMLRSLCGFIQNVFWTLPAYFFWPYCSELGQLLLILFYACTLSGGVALLAPCPRWMIFATLPVCVALVVAPFSNGTWMFDAIAMTSLGYVAFMAHLSRQLHLVARNALLLAEEKIDLIAQLSQAKQQSDVARARAEAANTSKSQFLANMSHELRTPLNAVLGFSEMIEKRVWGDEAIDRYAEYAASIHQSGAHLLQLINDILDLAKIEAGKMELNEERIELVSVARQALRLVETQARKKGVRVLIDASIELWLVADERALRQVCANLLSNAVKFTPKDGVVTVFIERCEGEGARLIVRDTGVGIRPEDLARVMESFGQGRHDAKPTDERGTGLGLPIVKGLVESHGGSIRLESRVGVGTAVIVSLPESRITEPPQEVPLPKIA